MGKLRRGEVPCFYVRLGGGVEHASKLGGGHRATEFGVWNRTLQNHIRPVSDSRRNFVIPPIAPKSGLRPKMGKKWPKNGFWPKRGRNGRRMGKRTQKWVKNGHFPVFRPFFPFFSGGAKIHSLAVFFPFRAVGPSWGLYRAIGIAREILAIGDDCWAVHTQLDRLREPQLLSAAAQQREPQSELERSAAPRPLARPKSCTPAPPKERRGLT